MSEESREQDLPPGTAIGEDSAEDEETLSPDEREFQDAQQGKGYGAERDE